MANKLWAGLDVGVETTSICVLDDKGKILREATCLTSVEAVDNEIRWLKRRRHARIGIESNGASLARGLRNLGYSIDLYETRQLSKFLRARRNKTDAGDASGIAEAGRVNVSLVSKLHLKSLECQLLQSRLVTRNHITRQHIRTANVICRQVELYGGRISTCTRSMKFRERVDAELRKLFGKQRGPLGGQMDELLDHFERLLQHRKRLDRELKQIAMDNEVCRRFMEIPGVGPLCALTFYSAVGDPRRFAKSADVGCYLGLTPKIHQSGLSMRSGRISKMGHQASRTLLIGSAMHFMKPGAPDSSLRRWTLSIEQRRGRHKARVATARKLAMIMTSMWRAGTAYNPLHEGEEHQSSGASESDLENRSGTSDSVSYSEAFSGVPEDLDALT